MSTLESVAREINDLMAFLELLDAKIVQLKGVIDNFQLVSKDYATYLNNQFGRNKTDLAHNAEFKQVLLHWLRSFVATADECHMLYSGGFEMNDYFAQEHRPFLHDRGDQNYTGKSCTTKKSTDGVDFEYTKLQTKVQKLSKGYKLEDKLDAVAERNGKLSDLVQGYIRATEVAFWEPLEMVLKNLGALYVITSANQDKHGKTNKHGGEKTQRLDIYPINRPYQYTLLVYPINTYYLHTID